MAETIHMLAGVRPLTTVPEKGTILRVCFREGTQARDYIVLDSLEQEGKTYVFLGAIGSEVVIPAVYLYVLGSKFIRRFVRTYSLPVPESVINFCLFHLASLSPIDGFIAPEGKPHSPRPAPYRNRQKPEMSEAKKRQLDARAALAEALAGQTGKSFRILNLAKILARSLADKGFNMHLHSICKLLHKAKKAPQAWGAFEVSLAEEPGGAWRVLTTPLSSFPA